MSQLTLETPQSWKGVWTALVTPLNSDLTLDSSSLEKLMESQIAAGLRGLVIAGSTGEGSLLPETTFTTLLKTARKIAGTRIPLVAGLGIGGTEQALKNGRLAKEAGYNGLLASTPAYIKAPQRGLVEHFTKVAQIGLPVCLYEIPGRAASSIQLSTLETLKNGSSAAAFSATKDATGDLNRMLDSKPLLGDRICFLSGDDLSFHGFLCHQGDGVISVVSHFIPKTLSKMIELVKAGKISESLKLQQKIQKFTNSLFSESNPIPTKTLLWKMGIISQPNFCPPLSPMTEKLLNESFSLLQDLKKAGLE
jgi:4-hydroxy-tetrahydrodipicolinate synthase